jgi:hypothetical protein
MNIKKERIEDRKALYRKEGHIKSDRAIMQELEEEDRLLGEFNKRPVGRLLPKEWW